MADVVQQRGELDLDILGCPTGKMVRAEGVLKPGVCGARVHEKCVTELPDVPQPLEGGRIDDRERLGLEADVVPERVANDLELGGAGGERRQDLGTGSLNCSKFVSNSASSRLACAS